jgi:hypothetical protein
MQKLEHVSGNQDVIELLEDYLQEARKGQTCFAGVVTVEGQRFSGNYAGDLRGFHVGFYALDYLQQQMRRLSNMEALETTSDGPANKFVYDLIKEPICHDFIVWLVTARMIMLREGARPPLRVGFRRGHEMAKREQHFFQNVMLPALELFGAVRDPISFEGRRLSVYTPKDICLAARQGEEVPRIHVPQEAMEAVADYLKGSEPVTITLREEETYPHRNSNLPEWCKFARWLEDRGEQVIFLRDTAKATEPLHFKTFPAGSRNVMMRVAIYEQAKCNCFVSNGPLGWALFGSRPFLAFHTVHADEGSECNTPSWWARNHGIVPGEQYPWSLPSQRLVYADDNFENLCAAWTELMPALQQAA